MPLPKSLQPQPILLLPLPNSLLPLPNSLLPLPNRLQQGLSFIRPCLKRPNNPPFACILHFLHWGISMYHVAYWHLINRQWIDKFLYYVKFNQNVGKSNFETDTCYQIIVSGLAYHDSCIIWTSVYNHGQMFHIRLHLSKDLISFFSLFFRPVLLIWRFWHTWPMNCIQFHATKIMTKRSTVSLDLAIAFFSLF